MGLFEVINVDNEKLKEISLKYWNVELGKCLKSSQNHTFLTTKKNDDGSEESFILRVTPDSKKERIESTKLEVELLSYLYDNELTVCPAIPNLIDGNKYLITDDLIICLFKFAIGEPINYMEFSNWMEKEKIIGLGKWFGKLHKLIPKFVENNKELTKNGARHWQTLHSGVLKGVQVDPKDLETSKDLKKFTIIHGDVNPSNYHWIKDGSFNQPCMFDWDQLQESWLLYDLSSPIWGVVSLETFGIAGNKVPEANSKQFTDDLLNGYESEIGEIVDRSALTRMIAIRRQLYVRFCKAAVIELADKPDSEMYKFCKRMTDNFENEEKQQQ